MRQWTWCTICTISLERIENVCTNLWGWANRFAAEANIWIHLYGKSITSTELHSGIRESEQGTVLFSSYYYYYIWCVVVNYVTLYLYCALFYCKLNSCMPYCVHVHVQHANPIIPSRHRCSVLPVRLCSMCCDVCTRGKSNEHTTISVMRRYVHRIVYTGVDT